MQVERDEETGFWYALVATEDVMRVGIARSERKARERALLVRDRWVSPDGRRSLYLGARDRDTIPKPLVAELCAFLGIDSPDDLVRR